MSRILHRTLGAVPPRAVSGRGAWITDADGRSYLDACGGAAVSCLGHDHPRLVEAVRRQLEALPYAHTGFFTTEVAEQLADRLVEGAPEGLGHVLLVGDGSEAAEAALKLARQYFVEIGEPARTRFIARRQSYHGNTLGALAAGGHAGRRALYGPMLMDVPLIAPCFAYRFKDAGETLETYGLRVADELEAEILRLGPETVAGFLAETVVGATVGCVAAAPGYFERIRAICDRYGVLLILDEVMCGMGRTGTLHACAQEGIAPDLLTLAKGLGGGYQPIGALLVSLRIHDAVAAGSGGFAHSHTYMGHATACAAALAVQEVLAEEDLLAAVQERGAQLAAALAARFGDHRHVGDIRGRGLFWAVELVTDRRTKLPFDPGLKLHARIKREAFARGLLVYPSGGTIDGVRGDHVLLAPPFIASAEEIDTIVDRLGTAIDAAIQAA